MSTLARTNSHSRKPQYKDYVSFLDSYRNGKKDDQNSVLTSDSGVNFSLNSSANNSSSSIFSDVSDKEHLPPKGKQTVRSEMYIEIKNPPQNYPSQTFKLEVVSQEPKVSVEKTAKIFENNSDQATAGSKAKQNSFKQNSVGEISKKFETNKTQVGKPPVKRATSIGEVSKIFENGDNQQPNNWKPKNFNAVPKPFQPFPKVNTDIKVSNKPAILSPKPVMAAPAFPKLASESSRQYPDSIDSGVSISPPQCASPPPLSPPPPPPPMPPSQNGIQKLQANKKLTNGHQQITVQVNGGSQANGVSTIDRNDPRVRKVVYGALRNMYGTYHDQANDYLATLPKNRVRKNNGLDSIIDSIASQGGLDKLNGRVNPKQETE